MIEALTWGALGLAAAGSVSVCALALRRIVAARAGRRDLAAQEELVPLALALIDGDPVDLAGLDERRMRILSAVLARYSQRVQGVETLRIAEHFERRGVVDEQLRRLHDRRAWRRASAAFALGDMASPRTVAPLIALLADTNANVRAAAARSLGRLRAAQAVGPLVHAFSDGQLPRVAAGQALLAIGPGALAGLRRLVETPEPVAREFAVELIGYLGDASDGRLVMQRLRDSSAEVRAKAARALGRLGAEEGATLVQETLEDRIVFVRAAAAHALAAVGDRRSVPALLRVARNDRFDAARAAAAAVARLDPEAVREAAESGPHLREAADLLAVVR